MIKRSPAENDTDNRSELTLAIERRATRMEKSRRERRHGLWFGLGMFGLVGWAIAVPTLAGIALGAWLDSEFPMQFSWKITLLFAGVIIGCVNAWWWVQRESESKK